MQTERLVFEVASSKHVADFQKIMGDPDMGKDTDVPCQPTEKKAAGFVEWMQRLNRTGKGRAWALRKESEVIGFIRLNKIDKRASVAIIGYEISKAHWGRGFGSEALRRVVEYSHQELDLHRLEAWTFNGNVASSRVLEKAGFLREGVQRSKVLHRNDRRDLWLFGRLISEPI